MNRKSVLIFSLGFLCSGVVFAAFFLLRARPAHELAGPADKNGLMVSKEFTQLEKESKESQPAVDSAPGTNPKNLAESPPAFAGLPLFRETALFNAFFSPSYSGPKSVYEVKKGDNLFRIAKKYGVTPGLIKKVNHLPSDSLRLGKNLIIPEAILSILVDKSRNVLVFKAGSETLKIYCVSTGENNSTPVGVFKITDKLINPTWYKAGAVVKSGSPQNVLGTRWMGISQKGYGIHGTTEPEKLGRQVTAGCIRMRNDEVEELYDLVPPGTQVSIVDKS